MPALAIFLRMFNKEMMLKKPGVAVAVVSAVLLCYCVLINFDSSARFACIIFAISPFLLLWMAYCILHDDKFEGQELGKDEEWGYADKNKDEL